MNKVSGLLKFGIACVLLVTAAGSFATTFVIEKNTSWSSERVSADHTGQDIRNYEIVVPAETRATVTIRRTGLYTECCGGGMRVNFGDGYTALVSNGNSVSRTLSAGRTTVRVEAYVGQVQQYQKYIGTVGPPGGQVPMYQWVYYDYYSCEGRYDLEVEFEKLQPDLSVSSLSVSESGIVMDDADVTAYFTVANALLKSCGAFGVDLLVDGTKQSSFTVDGLSAGSSVRKSVPLGRLAAGRHTIVVKADVGNAVAESSESNNERSLTFKVYGRTPYKVVFDRNGGKGEMSDQSFIFGTEQALSRNVFSGQIGYVFKGWATSPNGGIAYLDGQVVNNLDLDSDGIETLYAVWELDYETVDGLKFRIFEGAATLVSADGASGDVVIPSTVRGFPVTRIGVGAFKGLSRVTSIVVPDSVTDIGAYAFSGCPNLTSVVLRCLATDIGNYSFQGCSRLVSVELPRGLKQLSTHLFDECTSLVSITIPEGVEVVCSCAFEECKKLKGIDLPASVTNIGYAAFRECSALEYANIPEAVKSLDGEAFIDCSSLKSIVFPRDFKDIGYFSFGYCTSLTSVELPSGMVAIAQSAFSGCSGLTSVKIPGTVASIGVNAFSQCRSLKSIDLPVGVTNIGSSAFSYCTSLASITIPKGVSRIADYAYRGCKSLKSVSIPESVNGIGQGAFDECDGLGGGLVIIDGCVLGVLTVGGRCSGEVVLPEGTRLIADRAFYWNTDLRSITIPDSVMHIGSEAFKGCSGLSVDGCVVVRGVLYDYCGRSRTVSIPEGVTDIGDWAFYGRDVGSVTIPSSVTNIGRSAFSGCMYLSTKIPSGVKTIGELAFSGCRYMEQISVPSSVVSIGRSAFSSCYSLATVSLSEGLQSIGSSAFSSCHSLASISLPEGLQSIGDYTFDDCSALEEISIPSSVTEIGGNSVFRGCSNLKVIRVDERNQVYCSADGMLIEIAERKLILAPRGLRDVIIPEGIRSIGGDAFSGDKSLVFVSIPESVVDIAGFSGCSALKEISIPRGVKHVTGFANCTSLSTITLHSSVESIESGAFYGCNAIKKVYVDHGDGVRIMSMLEESGLACGGIGFVELPPEDASGTTQCVVTFDAAGGTAGWAKGEVAKGAAVGTLPTATREGYEFLGWFTAAVGGTQVTAATVVTADVTFYAQWTPIRYAITYVNTMGAANPNPTSYTIEDAVTFAALPDVEGRRFIGWSIAGISRGNTGDVTVSANWEDVTPSVIPDEEEPMDAGVANTYDGIIMDAGGLPVGYISIKAAKASGKGEIKTSKVTTTIQMTGEAKKVTVKGNVNVSEATFVQPAPDGRVLDLMFTRNSIFGTFDGYEIEGVRNILASTAKGDKGSAAKQRAEAIYGRLKGNYVMAYGDENGWNGLSVSVAAKGKVKVSGKLADGTSVATSTQLIVGEDYSCIPVIYTKKDVSLAFSIYFSNDGGELSVFGYYDAVISRVTALGGERAFCLDGDPYGIFEEAGYELVEEFLPWEVPVAPKGTKWIVADGAKAGQIKMDKDGEVYDKKESDNPSGLKLTFTAKTGLFKGSFKVYAIDAKGKLKSFSATVNGIVVDGIGYGTVTIKKIGSVPVAIE